MKKKSCNPKTQTEHFFAGVKESRALYLLMLPSVIIFLLFTYYPMYGVIIAFKDFTPADGILGSPWVGFKHFIQYFNSYQFGLTIRNTIVISLLHDFGNFSSSNCAGADVQPDSLPKWF